MLAFSPRHCTAQLGRAVSYENRSFKTLHVSLEIYFGKKGNLDTILQGKVGPQYKFEFSLPTATVWPCTWLNVKEGSWMDKWKEK